MLNEPVSRRDALRTLLATGAMLSSGCAPGYSQEPVDYRSGRLASRPPGAVRTAAGTGTLPLGLGGERDGFLHVPAGASTGSAMPLVVVLHGAGGSARAILTRLAPFADEAGCPLLVPDSRGPTWDAIRGTFGPDVRFIDRALQFVFTRLEVDQRRLVVSGFSDGASYALALGLINGDLFQRVLAFSPGFVPPGRQSGKPSIFISHGDNDPILPYEVTSRRIVANLQGTGYDVTLKEFAGGHTVPAEIARAGFAWAVGTPGG